MIVHPLKDFALLLREQDSVGVARKAIPAGAELKHGSIRLVARQDIPFGHKIAVRAVEEGAPVIRYGQIIGFAVSAIRAGDHVHSHNLAVKDFAREYDYCVDSHPVEYYPQEQMRSFLGYTRSGGRAGTRNYIAVISSVNCSASVSHYVANHFRTPGFKERFPHVDGIVPITHKTGCGMALGEGSRVLQRVLAGMARHPNIYGYVMIGLGCEVNQIQAIRSEHQLDLVQIDEPAPAFMTIQAQGGVRKTVQAAVEAVNRLLHGANAMRRTPQPVSKLILAENCGGSDGASGITANPALGVASDEIVRYGGASVLAETSEIYGAEHLLTRRAVTREVGEKLIERVHWWEDYVRRHDAAIDNNPSWGNKVGGLTTIYEKSLGAVAKGGQSPLAAVYHYAEIIDKPGLSFMDTPGFDPVSMTGLVAGGCNIGVFTTGRGSVYGCKPTPCIKIATNTPLFEHMNDDMDLNAGTILDGLETVEEVGARIFEKIIAVAGGERTKSEIEGIGDEEFAPWILGPTL